MDLAVCPYTSTTAYDGMAVDMSSLSYLYIFFYYGKGVYLYPVG